MPRFVYIPFFFLMMLFISNNSVSAERDKYNRIVDAVAFKTKISGTSWVYHWNGSDFTFGFEPDGKISKLKGWSKVMWSVNQRDEVVLTSGSRSMYLFFNEKGNGFNTVDWDGQKATGKLVFKDDL
jgi:hypothetical protein